MPISPVHNQSLTKRCSPPAKTPTPLGQPLAAPSAPAHLDAAQTLAPKTKPGGAPACPMAPAAVLGGPAQPRQTPAWLALGPCRSAAPPDAATIRATLARGRRFAPAIDAQLQQMCGIPFTAGGFEALFAPLLPAATWVVCDAACEGPGVSFELAAIDRSGRVVFEVGIALCAWDGGALEAHTYSADVDPQLRGLGLTARGEVLQEAILRALCPHPDARLTLRAGHQHDANSGAAQPANGALVHALRGYLFADSFGVRSPFTGYAESAPTEELALCDAAKCARQFVLYMQTAQVIYNDGRWVPSAARQALCRQAYACTQPYEFLALGGSTVLAPAHMAGGQQQHVSVGKAFFLSGQAPIWHGVRYVNDPAEQTPAPLRALRHQSRSAFAAQLASECKSAQARITALQQAVFHQFTSSDPHLRGQAYGQMARLGHPQVQWRLLQRLYGGPSLGPPTPQQPSQERHTEAQALLVAAMRLFDPRSMLHGLRLAAQDAERPTFIRQAMGDRLRSLAERPQAA